MMFEDFPKKRPPLPKEIQEIYSTQYKSNRDGDTTASSMAQKAESWFHRQVADDVVGSQNPDVATLELGAGTLNQLAYEPPSQSYDIVEPFVELYEKSPDIGRVRNVYLDISEVPSKHRYDRITSIATLEHVCNLPEVVARSGILLKEDGVFRAGIPNEGTLLWTLGWKLTTGLEFRLRHGLDYGLLMKHEHVNNANEIEQVLSYFFKEIKCKVFGLSKSLALYRYYECRGPIIDRCNEYSDLA